jgi:hypothetical protein
MPGWNIVEGLRRKEGREKAKLRASAYLYTRQYPLAKCTASILVLSVDKVEACMDAEEANQLESTPSAFLQPGSICLTFQVGHVNV